MSIEDARERLSAPAPRARDEAVFAAGRAGQGGPPSPGDLFVLAATAELPVEWAILERRSTGAGELLAVPADANPAAGSADVEVPAGARGGPLSLRCRFGAWLDAGLFAAAKRSGSLAPETVAEARQHFRRVEAGTLEPSPLAEEVDVDPEYVDWIRDVPEQALSLVLAASQRRSRSRPRRWEDYPLAAIFALLAIGLSVWVVQLRSEVRQLSQPLFDVPSRELDLGEQTRGSRTSLEVRPGASHILLLLVLDGAVPDQQGRFEIVTAEGKLVWRSRRVRLTPSSEVRIVLQRALLPDGEYRVRIVSDAGSPPLAESTLEIETAQKPAER
ncbi:MAG TPA: hypothetical protein VIE43_25620 [Thermoanaerobaculia bacterium]|jgi:hypothetical protein|nr:hypothetical protein [Thermoanaerobaculia bacterium]